MRIDTSITTFDGTGDLAFRELLPALYAMVLTGKLPNASRIVIIGHRDYDSGSYHRAARDWVEKFTRLPFKEDSFSQFAEELYYYQMNFSDINAYQGLGAYYREQDIGSHIFYYVVVPRFSSVTTQGPKEVKGSEDGKVILKEPLGENLASIAALNKELEAHLGVRGIYRTDHYLGKEMVRNAQAIRFANPIFTDAWNSCYTEPVQISALEDVSVEIRGGYYDASGVLKDMVQNHPLQILSITVMEKPGEMTPRGLHDTQLDVFASLRQADEEPISDVLVFGRYGGYRQEPLVKSDSETETFVVLKLLIDNTRWKGTPFYIRMGRKTGVRGIGLPVIFHRPYAQVELNVLIIKTQPTEGVYLQFSIKRPRDTDDIILTKMDFCQNCNPVHQLNTPEAYERSTTACIKGENPWFSQWDQVELRWNYVSRPKKLYSDTDLLLYSYVSGTPGPGEAGRMLGQGEHWLLQDRIRGILSYSSLRTLP